MNWHASGFLCALLALWAAPAFAGSYEPLAFLAEHCWQGTFADGKTTDKHCFSWVYGGKFSARPARRAPQCRAAG
jgi:hypothetical protein